MSFLRVGDRAAGASRAAPRAAPRRWSSSTSTTRRREVHQLESRRGEEVAALIAAGYPSDFNGEAYATVSGQNSNNSVRVSEEFLEAVDRDEDWHLRWRTDPSHVSKTVKARDLWRQIAEAAWQCADPGLQFDTTINDWHTCPEAGRINASNPCSEYMFLDNTACNLASLNLLKFLDLETGQFDVEAFRHAVRLWTIVLEISVLMAQFPQRRDRSAVLRLPHPRPRLRKFRHRVDAARDAVRLGSGSRLRRRGDGADDRRELRGLGRTGQPSGPVPRIRRQPGAHAARHSQSPACGVRRAPSEYEQLSVLPMPISADHVPGSLLGAARIPGTARWLGSNTGTGTRRRRCWPRPEPSGY